MSLKNKILLLVIIVVILALSPTIFINTKTNKEALYNSAMNVSQNYFYDVGSTFDNIFSSTTVGTVSLADIATVSYDLYSTGSVTDVATNLRKIIYRFHKYAETTSFGNDTGRASVLGETVGHAGLFGQADSLLVVRQEGEVY